MTCSLRDALHEGIIGLFGIALLLAPLTGNTVNDWFIFCFGFLFLASLMVTYTVGFRFDEQFRDVFLNDKNINNKLPLAMMSPKFLVSLRLSRAISYARNIVFPRSSVKNPIQYSWFRGYDFRKHARMIDFCAAYFLLLSVILLIITGFSSVLLSF